MNRLMSVKQAAEYTGLSPHTVYSMVSQRRIPHIKVGRLVKFDIVLLQRWIDCHTVKPIN